jgi:regulator of protease activity HflC (stomatin/prohibitin superfamily)
MVVMFGLYALSGFQRVEESERAIRLTFGRPTAQELGSGFQFSYPAPIGELVKIRTSDERLELNKEFFPYLSEGEEKNLNDPTKDGVQSLAGGGTDALDPDADGSLLTGDGNIAHARVTVTYQRAEPGNVARLIEPEFERTIVLGAVRRGMVLAAACLTLDEFITSQPDERSRGSERAFQTVEELATERANRILRDMGSGLEVRLLTVTKRIPPRRVIPEYNKVLSAKNSSEKAVEEARGDANATLTEAAGEAAPLLLALLDRYEGSLAAGERSAAERALADFDAVLNREVETVDGLEGLPARLSGEVTAIIDQARQHRSSVVDQARSTLGVFNAKRSAFLGNPAVMLTSEWADAYGALMARDSVQALMLPVSSDRVVLTINRDPALVRDQEIKRNQREFDEAEKQRNLRRERKRFEDRLNAESMRRMEG